MNHVGYFNILVMFQLLAFEKYKFLNMKEVKLFIFTYIVHASFKCIYLPHILIYNKIL